MAKSPTIRQLAQTEKPLVLPGAYDALSALLIKQAGFKGFFIDGFQTAGARYGLPDIGLAQFDGGLTPPSAISLIQGLERADR